MTFRSRSRPAYLSLGSRKAQTPQDNPVARPVAWCHATSDLRADALQDLAARLTAQRPDIPILLTFDRRRLTGPRDAIETGSLTVLPLDSDHPAASKALIARWRPAVGLWTGGHLMPNLLKAAQTAKVPMVLADIAEAELGRDVAVWLPDPQRAVLQAFSRIFAVDGSTSTRLQRQGIPRGRIQIAPRMRDSLTPRPCAEDDLAETRESLADRPVWFAVGLCAQEAMMLLTAHRHAVRLAHRLLLVVSPAGPNEVEVLSALLDRAGLRWENWAPGDPIGEFVQVLIAEDPDCLPLWFRLAPVCLMGGTLAPDGRPGQHPFEPAALGAAILHGPHLGAYAQSYDRLTEAGGARRITGAQHLGEVVLRLLQPDHAAKMALAGWEVVTQGAWITNQLLEIVQDLYDTNDVAHART